MYKFEKAKIIFKKNNKIKNYGKFIIYPFEKGLGITIGNSLRRTLLSLLPGGAVYSIKINGIFHEYGSIKGIKEDIAYIILNMKKIILKIIDDDVYTLKISEKGPKKIVAGDIKCPSNVKILNKNFVIANLTKNIKFKMKILVKNGIGYVSSEENKKIFQKNNFNEIGEIFVDSLYSPIKRVSYYVKPLRLNQNLKYDKLIIKIYTNGSIKPIDAFSFSAKILSDHFQQFIISSKIKKNNEFSLIKDKIIKKIEKKKVFTPIEELDLSARSYNCLKKNRIKTIEELFKIKNTELLKIKNFGKISLKEIIYKLNIFKNKKSNKKIKKVYK